MASERQIAANRRNAQKSSGPKSEEGKQRSSMNALQHGMTARVIVLPHEDSVEYHEIRAGLIESYAPANAHECMLVDQVAAGYWRTLRARRFETALLSEGARTYKDNHGKSMEPNAGYDDAVCAVWMVQMDERKLRNYYRYDGSIERQYYRAIAALEKAQAARFRREEQIERQLERTLRNAHPDTIAERSPEPPPASQVSENGTGFDSSQREDSSIAATSASHPIENVVSQQRHHQRLEFSPNIVENVTAECYEAALPCGSPPSTGLNASASNTTGNLVRGIPYPDYKAGHTRLNCLLKPTRTGTEVVPCSSDFWM